MESTLYPPSKSGERESEVKICKFLRGSDIIVSADMSGYLNFYAITPSPKKNSLLCQVILYNEKETIKGEEKIAFPIRGIDYDHERHLLFTGDEIGYLATWDVSRLVDKMDQVMQQYKYQQKQTSPDKGDTTFLTGTEHWEKIKFSSEDVKLVSNF